jgi:capsular exopolysaccharide synthesis family protein
MSDKPNPPASRSAEPLETSSAINWGDYLYALRDKFWLIILCTIAGVGTAVYQVNKAVPIYASRAVLQMEPEERILNIQSVRSDSLDDGPSFKTMVETLTSRTMMERVATRLKLDRDYVFMAKPEGREFNTIEAVAGALRGCIRVARRGDTRLIDITAEHTDAETAKRLADEVAAELIRFRFEVRNTSNQMANQFLLEEANRLREKLNRTEIALQEFREKRGMISLEKDQDIVISRFKELNTSLNQARDRRMQLEMDMAGASKLADRPDELIKLQSVAQQPAMAALLGSISEKESELTALARRYRAKHPKYINLVNEISQLKLRQPEVAKQIAATLQSAYEAARQTEERLAKEVRDKEGDTYSLGKVQVEYDAMKRENATDSALFDGVLKRLKETDLSKGLEQSTIKVVETAVASYVPVRPDKQKMLAQWSLGGLALGVMLAIGLYMMDSSIKTVDDAERTLQLPVLAAVTVRKTTAKKNPTPDLETVHHRHSPVSESFRTLRSSLILLGKADTKKTFMFTSAVPAEGKTFCASNFAVTLAQQGLRTVIIDCDLRKPTLGEIFVDNTKGRPGVADVLAGLSNLDDTIVHTAVPNLDVLPSGARSPNPSELLSGESFAAMLKLLCTRYDRVVIDTAPVLAVSDPLVIAPQVDVLCLVVRAHKTARHSALRACQALAKTGKLPSGLVLNRLPLSSAGYYYYYSGTYGNKRVYGSPA